MSKQKEIKTKEETLENIIEELALIIKNNPDLFKGNGQWQINPQYKGFEDEETDT